MVELAKGPAEAFGPLKAVLASISGAYAQYQVCSDALVRGSFSDNHVSQKTVAVKDKIEVLRSRIAKLEEIFEKPASDEKETKRREGLLMYASGLRFDQMLTPS